MSMRHAFRWIAFALCSSVCSAQQTIWLDYAGGATGTTMGNVNALTAGYFPSIMPGQTAALRNAITNVVTQDFGAFAASVNIVTAMPAMGDFVRVAIGNNASAGGGALGIANEIDFRNKRAANVVAVSGENHLPAFGAMTTLSQIAQALGNTISHEVAHVLGLTHSAPISTFVAAGGGMAGGAAVNANEIMAASATAANFFNNLSFGAYSRLKLDVGFGGVNVQPEVGMAVFTAPTDADPARAGDAGATVATGSALVPDAKGRATVLGTLSDSMDMDVFTFEGTMGQRVTFELFSQVLAPDPNDATSLGRIANPVDATIEIIDTMDAVIQMAQYDMMLDIDGVAGADFGSDALIYNFTLPADGMYGILVRVNGADTTGDYELFAVIPSSGAITLLVVSGVLATRRRRS